MFHTLFGSVSVVEQVWQHENQRIRPLSYVGMAHRQYSLGLQRAITDFGSEESWQRTQQRLKEHHGLDVPRSSIAKVTRKHAFRCRAQRLPATRSTAPDTVVTSTDGTILPTVASRDRVRGDKRKTRVVEWREVRLSVAQIPGEVGAIFDATAGTADQAGTQWVNLVSRCGAQPGTFVHAVCDGAPWIADQFKQRFKRRDRFLIDFFHVSEYLGAVAAAAKLPATWLKRQQDDLLANKVEPVLKNLRGWAKDLDHPEAGYAACVAEQYLKQRLKFLDYKGTTKDKLPVGSGKMESSHRSVLQKRLKIPGAWWTHATLEAMCHLRVLRANMQWGPYWQNEMKVATS